MDFYSIVPDGECCVLYFLVSFPNRVSELHIVGLPAQRREAHVNGWFGFGVDASTLVVDAF